MIQHTRPVRLTLVAITVLGLSSAIPARAQTRPSDVEMENVLRTLLELEVPRSANGSDVIVLLGPNVRSSWIPHVSGLSLRQLTYDEQKQVPEYYDLSYSFEGNAIEIALMKGNYCKKVGRRYRFRKQSGTWLPKEIGYIESKSPGSTCAGCALGSSEVYSVRRQFPSLDSERSTDHPRERNLVLNGEVGQISCSKDDTNYIRCKTDLKLKFTNTGLAPLIILQPNGDYEFWHGGASLVLSEKDSHTNSFVYSFSAWPSIYQFPEYRRLADLLDQPTPPNGVTQVLSPGGSWLWDTSIELRFQENNTCNQHVGVEIGWKAIKGLAAPLWLRVSYEMWPFNVENFKPNLGGKLKKRWQGYGSLYLDGKADRYWHATLTSEPIELRLSKIELRHNGDGNK